MKEEVFDFLINCFRREKVGVGSYWKGWFWEKNIIDYIVEDYELGRGRVLGIIMDVGFESILFKVFVSRW